MQNMLVYSTDWNGTRTFRMLPTTLDCPFNEAIYDPTNKVLAIIARDKKEKPQMLPKLNDKGQLVPMKGGEHPQYVEERRMMETYYEYYLDELNDIMAFITRFAVNPTHASIDAALTPATE